jgi:hypothetical protein
MVWVAQWAAVPSILLRKVGRRDVVAGVSLSSFPFPDFNVGQFFIKRQIDIIDVW